MKKLISLVMALALMVAVFACVAGAEQVGAGKTVGIAMPTQSSERWIKDGGSLGSGSFSLGGLGSSGSGVAAASDQSQSHGQSQDQCESLLHSNFSLKFFLVCAVRM